jgi:hypothetical protein
MSKQRKSGDPFVAAFDHAAPGGLPSEASVELDAKAQELVIKVPAEQIAKLVLENAKRFVKVDDVIPEDGNVYVVVIEHHKGKEDKWTPTWLVNTSRLDESNQYHAMLAAWIAESMEKPSSNVVVVPSGSLKLAGYYSPIASAVVQKLPSVVHAVAVLVEQ